MIESYVYYYKDNSHEILSNSPTYYFLKETHFCADLWLALQTHTQVNILCHGALTKVCLWADRTHALDIADC